MDEINTFEFLNSLTGNTVRFGTLVKSVSADGTVTFTELRGNWSVSCDGEVIEYDNIRPADFALYVRRFGK